MSELIETPRGSFLVEQRGPRTAQPLVFVAGLGDDHSSWDDPIGYLSDAYRCIAFDNRGIGQSPITRGPYTTAELAADAQVVVAALGLSSVVALGSSMGGAICQEWALAYPETISHLVLSNTWAERDVWFSALIEHWVQLAVRGAGQDVLYQLGLFCFSPRYLSEHPTTIGEFLDAGLPDLTGFIAAAAACQQHDALKRLPGIEIPTLVIGGEHDILTRPELTRSLAAAMRCCQVAWIPAGHMTFWEQPAQWARTVKEFIAGSHPSVS